MADVAAVGERVVLTYAVPGHYDADTTPKSSRSSRDGVAFAADRARRARGRADLRRAGLPALPRRHRALRRAADRPRAGARALRRRPVRRRRGDGRATRSAPITSSRSSAMTRSSNTPATRVRSRRRARARWRVGAVRRGDRRPGARRRIACRCSSCSAKQVAGRHARRCTCRAPLVVPVDLPLRYSATRDAVRARRERIPQSAARRSRVLRRQDSRLVNALGSN